MTRPRLVKASNQLVTGLVAVALFAVFAGVFLTAQLGSPTGFPEDGSITASIGYLMFNLADLSTHSGEEFLVAFEIIDAVLVAALVGAVMLARREEDGSVTNVLADGGRELGRAVRGRRDDGDDDSDEGGADP
ncbi:NADH-quinone oxidoreductase subunit J family protein [Halorientalis marina]|jgi:NADH-quinone oxidoreductase subunit J|uniref:NADH-quinone oxidoreductase subunit J family protein n=1 Tax=Halorientalis marina TaxID=2931976 RepID=UPI001FF3CDC6|nr:hypothetical protein [Halorientalis marina]